MINLAEETLEALEEHGKSPDDVLFISGNGKNIPINVFWQIADRKYDNSYGAAEVNGSLYIVGDNWWLERGRYDGSEWWEYKTMPERPEEQADPLLFAVFDEWALKLHKRIITWEGGE